MNEVPVYTEEELAVKGACGTQKSTLQSPKPSSSSLLLSSLELSDTTLNPNLSTIQLSTRINPNT